MPIPPSPQTVSIADSGTACSVAGACAKWPIGSYARVLIQIYGTFTATLTFEGSIDGQTWSTLGVTKVSDATTVTTATAAGLFALVNPGLAWLRARCTAYTSGDATLMVGGSD